VEGRVEGVLGALALTRGDLSTARQHYERSVALLERGGDTFQALRMGEILRELDGREGAREDAP
jgi:hypothetical protein